MAPRKTYKTKLCVRCNKILPLGDFYTNKDWKAQAGYDAWCRECAAKHCYDMQSLRQYCFENNRKWEDSFYDSALKKAQYVQANDEVYISQKTSQKKRDDQKGRAAARAFFSMMNMSTFYGFTDNMSKESAYAPRKEKTDDDGDEETLSYSAKWGGRFTQTQIDALEDIYAQYEEDFVLDNVNIRDYARKVAKASLNADIAEDRMRHGQIPASEYKEAQKIFDDLSKSSNFAACRRKPGEASGLGSQGEIILRLETSGALNVDGVKFPEDDVDKIIKDFRHTLVAVGAEGRI